MARWPDIAEWRGPTPNTSGSVTDHMYVVVHTADGSYEGTIAWQKNPAANVSSHFVVAKDGRIAQMLDTNAKSWTQINGNPYSISIENEGNENTPLTDAQLTANAKILARAHQVHGIPLQLTSRVGTRGLGHHSMGAESGVNWGHSLCPGNIIKAQKPEILARAVAIVGGVSVASSSSEGDPMYVGTEDGGRWAVGPAGLVHIEWDEWLKSGFDKAAPPVLIVPPAKLAAFQPGAAVTVDVKALAAALAGQLNLDQAAVVAALASPEGQAALVTAANTAEDS